MNGSDRSEEIHEGEGREVIPAQVGRKIKTKRRAGVTSPYKSIKDRIGKRASGDSDAAVSTPPPPPSSMEIPPSPAAGRKAAKAETSKKSNTKTIGEKTKHATGRSQVEQIRAYQRKVRSDREIETRGKAMERLRKISEQEEVAPAATSETQELTRANMELALVAAPNTAIAAVSAAALDDVPSAAPPSADASYSEALKWAVTEMMEKNRELAQIFTDAVTDKMGEDSVSLKNVEQAVQKIWSAKISSDAKISAASDAVETMTRELSKLQDDRETDKQVLQKYISSTGEVASRELEKFRDNEQVTVNSLALRLQEVYAHYFELRRASPATADAADTMTKCLEAVRVSLTSETFVKAITHLLGFKIRFIYSGGAKAIDSFQKAASAAAAGDDNAVTPEIIVTAPDHYHSEGTPAEMLAQMNSRHQTAMLMYSYLDSNALSKLNDARRVLEEGKRFLKTQQAIERESALSALNRMDHDLVKLSHSANKIMPAINDSATAGVSGGSLNSAIRNAILADNISISTNAGTILVFSDNVVVGDRALWAETRLKTDRELMSNLVRIRQFVTDSTTMAPLVLEDDVAMVEMETEEEEHDNMRKVRKAAETVSAAASDLASNLEELYNRVFVESYSDRVANAVALGTAAGRSEGVITDILKTFLEDFKNRSSQTDNLIQDTAHQQSQAVEQLQQRLDEMEKKRTSKGEGESKGEYKGQDEGKAKDSGEGECGGDGKGQDEGRAKANGECEGECGGDGDGGECLKIVAERLSLEHRVHATAWIGQRISKLNADLTRAENRDDLRAVRDSFNKLLMASLEEIGEKTSLLFARFTSEAKAQCNVTNSALLAPYVDILLVARKAAEEEFKISLGAFSNALEERATALRDSPSSSPMEVVEEERRRRSPSESMEEEEAKQDLLDTVRWAKEAAEVVTDTGVSKDTGQRTIMASLEDGKNVITMEAVDLSDPKSIDKPQTWTGKDPSLAKEQYEKEEPHVSRVVAEMNRAATASGACSGSARFVKRHGLTTQGFPYYLSCLSYTESDVAPTTIVHPEHMRPVLPPPDPSLVEGRREQELKILASDLMRTLRDNNGSAAAAATSTLNMLIYNVFFVDAQVLRNISAACYKYRDFLAKEMGDAPVRDGGVKSKLLEATVAILFTACRHVFGSAANAPHIRLAAMASSVGKDRFRLRVCHVMYSYLQKYLRLCIRRVNTCLRTLRSTGLASKRMMAAPQTAQGVGSRRVSSFEVKYDFSMLYKLLSFQAKNITLLCERGLKTLESTVAALAAFVADARLPISDPMQRSTVPMTGNEIVLPSSAEAIDAIHAHWNIAALKELTQLLTQYSAWLSTDNNEEEPEKLIRVCRAAAGAAVTCLKTVGGKSKDELDAAVAPLLQPLKSAAAEQKQYKTKAAGAVTALLTDVTGPSISRLEKVIGKRRKNDSTVGSILTSTTEAGSVAAAAHVFISGFKDYLHDPEDFWGACVPFPSDGEGTELEGWDKAYNDNAQDVLEDFSDLSAENNSSMQGLLVPPDFAALGRVKGEDAIRGSNGYVIKTTVPEWHDKTAAETDLGSRQDKILHSDGRIKYLRPADGVTISVPGKDKLRKCKLLNNALASTLSYTRPVFDAQFQINVHFETPKLVLLPQQSRWTHNVSSIVSAAVWNVPSIRLLYAQLTHKEENNRQDPPPILVDDNDINRAIGDIRDATPPDTNNTTWAVTSALESITKKKKNEKDESNKFSAIDELALAPALLRRSGTAPFKPRGVVLAPGRAAMSNIIDRASWWTSDKTQLERAETAAGKFLVLTPCILDINPPTK